MQQICRPSRPWILIAFLVLLLSNPCWSQGAADENPHGPCYAAYQRARHAQAKGDFEKALAHYVLVDSPVLRDAAGCYIGQTLGAMGRSQEAIEHLESFVAAEPDGLYRGEAMLELGKLYLLSGSLHQARRWLDQAWDWQERIAQTTPQVTVDSIQAILEAFPVPVKPAGMDIYGNYHRNRPRADSIMNRLTSGWYLQDLGLQIALYRGFVLYQLDDPGARQALEAVVAINQAADGSLLRSGDIPDRLVRESEAGAFLIPPATWRALNAEHALRLQLGCYLLVAGDREQASHYFRQVLEVAADRQNDLLEWSVAEIGLSVIDFQVRGPRTTTERLEKFDTVLSESPLAPFANLLLANIQAGRRNTWAKSQQRYGEIIKSQDDALAARALLSLALAAANHEAWELARKSAEALVETYPHSRYASTAQTILSDERLAVASSSVDSQESSPQAASTVGRIVAFDRLLVIPGAVDFRVDMEQFREGDLMAYEIAYTVTHGCRQASLWYRLSIYEPQPPEARRSPLAFQRAPVLAFMQ